MGGCYWGCVQRHIYFASVSWVNFAYNVKSLWPYFGWPLLTLSTVGIGLIFSGKRKRFAAHGCMEFIACLVAITCLLAVYKHVQNWYPWATKRFLPCTVPLLAMLACYPLYRLWIQKRNSGKIAALLLLLGALGISARQSWRAWSHTEYNGVSSVLARIADQIDERDIVVADHFWWGTPSPLYYGKQVLNGEPLWRYRDSGRMQIAMNHLAKQHRTGQKIWFLTSSPKRIDIFPVKLKSKN